MQPGLRPGITPINPEANPSFLRSEPRLNTPVSEHEPTSITRTEIGQRMFESVPPSHRHLLGSIRMWGEALSSSGNFDIQLALQAPSGGEMPLVTPPMLHELIVLLWERCRLSGRPFRRIFGRVVSTPQGLVTQVTLEQ
jgi:hypothetical protein